MSTLPERRKYLRCNTLVCKALLSTDRIKWDNIEIKDISAGGLLFSSNRDLSKDMILNFNIYVYNMLSEFNIMLEGRVVRADRSKEYIVYAIKFENINKYQQVQLDELIKSKITIGNKHDHIVYDQEYSDLLLPQLRPRRKGPRIGNYK